MTALAATPVCDGQLDLLEAVAAADSPLTPKDFMDVCMEIGRQNNGWVNPNLVSARLHQRFDHIKPQWLSAQWAPACGPNGFLNTTDVEVPIDPTHSRGNGNKGIKLRRVRGWAAS